MEGRGRVCVSRSHPEATGHLACPRVPASPALTRGPLSPGLPGRPASPCGNRDGEWGAAGRGAVVPGGTRLPGYLRHPSLHALPAAQVSGRQPGGEKHKSPASSCSLPAPQLLSAMVPHGPHSHRPPRPTLPPCHAARSAPGHQLGPALPSPLAPPGRPRQGGKGQWVRAARGDHRGCRGEQGLSTAPSTPRSRIVAQPAGTAPPEPNGRMDGWTDGRRGNASCSDITFGPLLPVRPTIPWVLERESTCHRGPGRPRAGGLTGATSR